MFERNRPAAAFGGSFRIALNAPPYGRRRATLQPPPKAENNGLRKEKDRVRATPPLTSGTSGPGRVVPFCSAPVVNFHSALDTRRMAVTNTEYVAFQKIKKAA